MSLKEPPSKLCRWFAIFFVNFILASCVAEDSGQARQEKVMMDGYNICKDGYGGAGELIQKLNGKFAKSVSDLSLRARGPAFAARLSERNFQQQNAILNVLETSARNCKSSPVTPDQIRRVRAARDEEKSSYDRWMRTAPQLFRDAPQRPSDVDVVKFIDLIARISNAYSQAQSGAYGGYRANSGYSGTPGGSSAGCGSECVVSDVRLKMNIEKFEVTADGLTIYNFSYIPEVGIHGRYRGVIAQDLLTTKYSSAAMLSDSGYFRVDYSQLPIDFIRLD